MTRRGSEGDERMIREKSFHSICRWTFNAGKGGFVPSRIRPGWDSDQLDTTGVATFAKTDAGMRITTMALTVVGQVPGRFRRLL